MAAQRIPAKELGLALPIGFLTMPTAAAGAARVPGVYEVDGNPGPGRLIGDVLPQLEERPGVPLVAMFALNRCSLPDSA